MREKSGLPPLFGQRVLMSKWFAANTEQLWCEWRGELIQKSVFLVLLVCCQCVAAFTQYVSDQRGKLRL